MDLYDILIAKKLAGGGGGGGGNVETATIVITVTNGTATITSGAFPDWCTEANSDYVYGKVFTHNVITEESGEFEDSGLGIYQIQSCEGKVLIQSVTSGDTIILTTDLTTIALDMENITSGTLTVTLIYMPN